MLASDRNPFRHRSFKNLIAASVDGAQAAFFCLLALDGEAGVSYRKEEEQVLYFFAAAVTLDTLKRLTESKADSMTHKLYGDKHYWVSLFMQLATNACHFSGSLVFGSKDERPDVDLYHDANDTRVYPLPGQNTSHLSHQVAVPNQLEGTDAALFGCAYTTWLLMMSILMVRGCSAAKTEDAYAFALASGDDPAVICLSYAGTSEALTAQTNVRVVERIPFVVRAFGMLLAAPYVWDAFDRSDHPGETTLSLLPYAIAVSLAIPALSSAWGILPKRESLVQRLPDGAIDPHPAILTSYTNTRAISPSSSTELTDVAPNGAFKVQVSVI